jgi:cytochrome c551/c552
MIKKAPIFALVAALALGLGSGIAVFTQEEAELPEIPGITVEDAKPLGCVDCHKPRPDIGQDFRLSLDIKQWATEGAPEEVMNVARAAWPEAELTGMHPEVSAMVAAQELPGVCLTCHGANTKMPLAPAMHLYHYSIKPEYTGEDPTFLRIYGGFCTQCHALDLEVGTMIMKSGKEKTE